MSIRQYRPRRNNRHGASRNLVFLTVGFAITTIICEIAYPLTHGRALTNLTITTVYVAALTMALHALIAFGKKFLTIFLTITLIYGFLVEEIGVKSGWPFGTYHYDHSLGIQLAGVPLLVPCAWVMMAYPVLIAARKVAHNWAFLYGGLALMAWDIFLDPQMVAAGRWHWKMVGPHSPFASQIPLSNTAGWLFAGMGLIALLNKLTPQERRKNGASTTIPDLFLAWTLFAGVVGNIFFFHRPGLGLFGGFLFAGIMAPYLFALRFGRPDFE
jgi:putative membrane protein